jgi:L,D-peptidoglycan transpeptidase YkuD (ErfK/YbiS/YcfS/YnhG family)
MIYKQNACALYPEPAWNSDVTGLQWECKGLMRPYLRELLVTSTDRASRGILQFAGGRVTCALGRSGISSVKREGDGATPAGRSPLRRVLYRPDQVAAPETGLPVAPIAFDNGWCDDPADPCYNRPVRLPYHASAEPMWRGDRLYDIVVVIGHNDNPVVPGLGSAIFMHLSDRDNRPTAGCIALSVADMLTVLRHCGPETDLIVRA